MKRYKAIAFEFDDPEGTGVALDIIEHEEGEYVKYEDIKYLLKTTSSNSEYVKLPRFKPDYPVGIDETFSKLYTREPPKTRARIMAEEIASAQISNKKDLVDIIEQTINTHMKELKGEE